VEIPLAWEMRRVTGSDTALVKSSCIALFVIRLSTSSVNPDTLIPHCTSNPVGATHGRKIAVSFQLLNFTRSKP